MITMIFLNRKQFNNYENHGNHGEKNVHSGIVNKFLEQFNSLPKEKTWPQVQVRKNLPFYQSFFILSHKIAKS